MIEKISKRDGTIESPNSERIKIAILSAMMECDCDAVDEALAENISKEIIEEEKGTVEVEKIQDLVLKKLRKNGRKDVAKEYSNFRNQKTIERAKRSELMKQVGEKLSASNVQNQNANVDEHSFGGRVGEASDIVLKDYALNNCVSEVHKENHLNNEIYIHDLNSFAVGSHNCLTLPVDDLMKNGANTRQTDIRPANSINTFFQLLAVYFQLQSLQQFGGISASHVDWSAVPYFRKSFYKHYNEVKDTIPLLRQIKIENVEEISIDDKVYRGKWFNFIKKYVWSKALKRTKKELDQAVEGMFHNLNTLQSRSGNQLPFSSINYGTCTLLEGRIIIESLINGSLNGVGKFHKTSIFPCCIFKMKKGVNREKGDPNYDLFQLALKSTAQRLYPNYANVDWSGNEGYDPNDPRTEFSTMG